MAKKYHVLMVRSDGHWHGPEFGDYDKSVVNEERDDYRDRGFKAKDLHVLTVNGDTQADILEAVGEFKAARETEDVSAL